MTYQEQVTEYIGESENVAGMADQLGHYIEERQKEGKATDWLIFIPNLESFIAYSKMDEGQIQFIFEKASQVGFHLIIGGDYQALGLQVHPVMKYIRLNAQWLLFGMKISSQNLLDKGSYLRDDYPEVDEVYLHSRKWVKKLKISKI